jgi:hypothetical protein
MPYDETFAARVRDLVGGSAGLSEQKMFGGVGWMIHGNLAVGTLGQVLICRVGSNAADALLDEPGVDVFDLTGRPMQGWLTVDIEVLDDETLQQWVDRGVAFASSLPAKPGK